MPLSHLTPRLLLLLALVPAGCRRASSNSQTHEVAIHNFEFQPATLTVHTGETVRWKNSDAIPHSVVDLDGAFGSGSMPADATWSYVATRTGTFHYECSLHPNMQGTLVVQ